MSDIVYDVPISEVAKILGKSDRQVRRYVKDKRLTAKPTRVDGHIKLMFSRDEVLAFGEHSARERVFEEPGRQVVADARLIQERDRDTEPGPVVSDVIDIGGPESGAVRYVIDALREQIQNLQKENRELHYQLEQRSGQVGFLQGKVETLEQEMKMLMPAKRSREDIVERKPWYRRLFGRGSPPGDQS